LLPLYSCPTTGWFEGLFADGGGQGGDAPGLAFAEAALRSHRRLHKTSSQPPLQIFKADLWSQLYCFVTMTRRFQELSIDTKTIRVFLPADGRAWSCSAAVLALQRNGGVKISGKITIVINSREIPGLIQSRSQTAKMLSASLPWSFRNYITRNKIHQSDLNHSGKGSS